MALVTGANKGLGRETVRRLLAAGLDVYLASRDAERGRVAAGELGARALQLDITDDASVTAAAEQVRREVGHLDVLVNNAAVVGALDRTTEQVDAEDLRVVHETNVLGLVRVTHAFLPLLQTSPAGVVVNVSSGMGSLGRTSDPTAMESRWPSLAYASSKAAVNMLTVQYAKAFPTLRINAVDPGLTATDATGGMGKDITEGVQAAVAMALIGADGPTATFTDSDGPVPW
ncbi:SDR family NAD(P)-dependent oxidoreductase [Kineosporiaceae bacterium B12]|nr:SDR family NAD(P)-dependent oxidoreductase [Kineococcus rubinsiae]